MAGQIARSLPGQGLNRDKYDRLARIAVLGGQVRTDAWQRCSGVSPAPLSAHDLRDAWRVEGYAGHVQPARLGKAVPADALGALAAAKACRSSAPCGTAREGPVRSARLYALRKRNRWTGDPFLHRPMRKQWQGGKSHGPRRLGADAGACTAQVWHGWGRVHLQCLKRGQRMALPLKGTHLPSDTLRVILQAHGQVAGHLAVDEEEVCRTRPWGPDMVGVDKGCTDSDGGRRGAGLGDRLAAGSDHGKAKGRTRNQLERVRDRHAAGGHTRKARHIERHNPGMPKRTRRRRRHKARTRDRPCRAAHAVVDKAGPVACEDLAAPMPSPVPPQGHDPSFERLGQGWDGGHPNFDIPVSRFDAGLGPSGLHIANMTAARACGRARVQGTGLTVAPGLCWTRTPRPPATVRRGCTTTGVRCPCPTG